MKKLFTICFALFVFFCASAKEGYNITIIAPQLATKSIYLAGYYQSKIYAFDTISLDIDGKGTFHKNKKLGEGMYVIYIHQAKYYDIMLGNDQNLVAKIDTSNILPEIQGATQSEAFVELGKFIAAKRIEQGKLKEELSKVGGDAKKEEKLNESIKKLDDEVIGYQNTLSEKYKGEVMGLFAKALIMPQFPSELANGDMKDESFLLKRYEYAKSHFWDNVDLKDKRCWRLNFIGTKLDDYLKNMIIQNPDSLVPVAIDLIEKTRDYSKPFVYDKKDPSSYESMVNYMINYSVNSKIMCMDKLLVTLADRYYFTGLAPWADSTLMANISSEVRKVRYNQCGMKAANIRLTTFEGNTFSLHDVKSKYTLVYFYEPSCGHCKEVTPKLYNDVYQKYRYKGFEVVAICLSTSKKEWKDFMDEHKLYDWKNAWDPNRYSNYWVYYDTSTTPSIYLLDEGMKIVAKKIDTTSLDKILDIELNKK